MNRKEAIEYIRWYFTEDDGMAADASVKEAIQALVPELKKSEDERIRKEILEFVRTRGGFKGEWIAWLEKQKERKPVNWTELNWEDINKLEVLINNVHNEYPNGIGQESFGEEVLERFREYKEGEDIDEKEQKPTKNGFDAINLSKLLAADRLTSAEMTGRLKERNEILENPEKYGLQKPAEWSEEDENIRHDIIARLESLLKYETQYIAKACLQKEISWFKSLSRPKPSGNWKPSKYLLSLVKKVADGEMLTGVDQMAMGTLHEELKKL